MREELARETKMDEKGGGRRTSDPCVATINDELQLGYSVKGFANPICG